MPPALIIIDLQNDFIAPDGLFKKSHIPLGPILRPICQLFHDQGWPIVTICSEYGHTRPDNGDALEEVSNLIYLTYLVHIPEKDPSASWF